MAHKDVLLGERVERALANAEARGVDLALGRPSPEYADYKPHTGAPKRRPDGLPGVYDALGHQTRVAAPLGYSRHELAFAAAQMDKLELAAVLWCGAGDQQSRATLKAQLLIYALGLKDKHGWPKTFRRVDCEITGLVRCAHQWVTDLCTLALMEGRDPHFYRTELARARWFGVSDRHWRRSALAGAYSAIYSQVVNWFENGCVHLVERLTGRARQPRAS